MQPEELRKGLKMTELVFTAPEGTIYSRDDVAEFAYKDREFARNGGKLKSFWWHSSLGKYIEDKFSYPSLSEYIAEWEESLDYFYEDLQYEYNLGHEFSDKEEAANKEREAVLEGYISKFSAIREEHRAVVRKERGIL